MKKRLLILTVTFFVHDIFHICSSMSLYRLRNLLHWRNMSGHNDDRYAFQPVWINQFEIKKKTIIFVWFFRAHQNFIADTKDSYTIAAFLDKYMII